MRVSIEECSFHKSILFQLSRVRIYYYDLIQSNLFQFNIDYGYEKHFFKLTVHRGKLY